MNTLLPRRLDTRTLAGATLAALAPGLALAGPHGESVVAGAATIGRPDALTTLVQQTSNAAVINWQQFNVGASEFVVFQQPSSSSVVLNRVIRNDASQIFGSIAANGRVFLSNPNGVLFGPGARLDVNGLVATTFGISDDDFMAGRYAFARAQGAPDAGAQKVDRDTQQLQEEMSAELGARVEIKSNSKGGGKLVIEYSSNDHLEELLSGLRKGR